MINVFLRFNKYKVKHMGEVINGPLWESQGLDPIKQFSQTKT